MKSHNEHLKKYFINCSPSLYIQFLVSLLYLLCFSSCAFKETAQAPEIPQVAPPTMSQSKKEMDLKANLSWEGIKVERKLIVSREGDRFLLSAPITISFLVPERIQVEFSVPSLFELQDPLIGGAQAKILPESESTALELPVKNIHVSLKGGEKAPSQIQFELTGLRALLSDSQEGAVSISVKFFSIKSPIQTFELQLTLMTPPEKIDVTQKILSIFKEQNPERISEKIQFLNTPKTSLSLLQVIEVKNNSSQAIVLELPSFIQGKLAASLSKPQFKITDEGCYFQQTEWLIERIEYGDESFRIFPLTEDLLKSFLTFEDKTSTRISTGETALFGIYGTGELIQNFSKNGPPEIYTKQTVSLPRGCNFHCFNHRSGEQLQDIWDCQGISDGKCRHAHTCTVCAQGRENYCVSCHDFDIHQSDASKRYCYDDWYKTVLLEDFQAITRRHPIFLEINSESTSGKIQYAFAPPTQDPAFREKKIFLDKLEQWSGARLE